MTADQKKGKSEGAKQATEGQETKRQRTKRQEPEGQKAVGYTGYQTKQRLMAKQGIAKYVVREIIDDGMFIFLDAGSTVYQIGHELFADDTDISGLTILTNNMLVFNEFTDRSGKMSERGHVLTLTGGVYNQNHEALFGQVTEQVLKLFNPLIVIIGTSGFAVQRETPHSSDQSPRQGAFHHDIVSEIVTKRAIALAPTLHRVVVCDYSKIGVWDTSCFATIHELAANTERCTIVTNTVPDGLSPEDHDLFEKRYLETRAALRDLSLDKVSIVRVDSEGRELSDRKPEETA